MNFFIVPSFADMCEYVDYCFLDILVIMDGETYTIDRPKTRRQHYVPQFFLKDFTLDGNTFFVLRKDGTSNPAAVKDVLQKRDLYETMASSEGASIQSLFPNSVERCLGELEKF